MSIKNRRPERDTLKKGASAEPPSALAAAPATVSEHEATPIWPPNPEFALKPLPRPEDYADYVEHPRFGKAPRYTGLDPNPDSPMVHLHYNTGYFTEAQLCSSKRSYADFANTHGWTYQFRDSIPNLIPGTAVEADLARQTRATVSVTHYYDLDSFCSDCQQRFIFFAEEQKYWYEDLGIPLEAQADRCSPCRKRRQNIARIRRRYEELLPLDSKSVEETLEMADCCLTLVEAEVFSIRQCERVRMLLKRVPEDRRSEETFRDLTARLHAVERKSRGGQDAAPSSGAVAQPSSSVPEEEPQV
jgi:hypothetical protein